MRSVKDEMERYFDRLWPICRSLTGDGVRESLSILGELVDLKLYEVDSGTQVHDWEIPNEWNIRDAYIITPEGEKIADFKVNNLHLWSYSEPINGEFSYDELLPHLSSLPSQPSAIPYITTYYKRNWGLSLPRRMPLIKYLNRVTITGWSMVLFKSLLRLLVCQ